jgi:hypothetical protein
MRIINLDPGIHFTIGEADTIQLTMDGLEKTSKESGSATPFKSSWTVSFPLPADTSQRGSFAQAAGGGPSDAARARTP